MGQIGLTKADYRLGAVYRVGSRRKLPRPAVEALLVARCKLNAKQAEQLAGHWFASRHYVEAA